MVQQKRFKACWDRLRLQIAELHPLGIGILQKAQKQEFLIF